MTVNFSRRDFLISCLTGTSALYLSQKSARGDFFKSGSANDRVRVGIIGFGQNGQNHLENFLKLKNVEVCAFCDINPGRLRSAASIVANNGLKTTLLTSDYRRLADMKNLDAVSIA